MQNIARSVVSVATSIGGLVSVVWNTFLGVLCICIAVVILGFVSAPIGIVNVVCIRDYVYNHGMQFGVTGGDFWASVGSLALCLALPCAFLCLAWRFYRRI